MQNKRIKKKRKEKLLNVSNSVRWPPQSQTHHHHKPSPISTNHIKYFLKHITDLRSLKARKCIKNTRACLDPQLKDYGSIDFTLNYLSAEIRVNEA